MTEEQKLTVTDIERKAITFCKEKEITFPIANYLVEFAKETSKELQETNHRLTKQLEDLDTDNDYLEEQNNTLIQNLEVKEKRIINLEKQIEKMKNQWNCKNNNGYCVSSICPCKDKWELAE